MAAVDEIAIKLGVKVGDLKAALADAGATVKKFKKDAEGDDKNSLAKQFANAKQGIEKFRSVLAGAGVVALLRQINEAANKFAEDYTGAYDEAIASTLRLKNENKDLSSVISGVVGRVGVELNNAMDKFGTALGSIVYGTDAASDALVRLDAENKKAFDDAKLKKFREEEDKLAKVLRDNALQQADDNGKINLIAGEFVKLLQEQAKLQKGSIEYVKKSIEVETKRGELQKQDAETRKKEAEERKKETDDAARDEKAFQDERARNFNKLAELYQKERDTKRETLTVGQQQNSLLTEERDLQQELNDLEEGSAEFNETYARLLEVRSKFSKTEADAGKSNLEVAKLLLVPEAERTEIQKEQLRLLTGETTEHEQQLELARLLNIGVEQLTDAERGRLLVLTGQTQEMKKQTAEKTQQLALEKLYASSIKQTGNVQTLSNVQLDQLIQNLNKSLGPIKQSDASYFGVGTTGGSYKSIEQLMLQGNLDQAIKERDLRSSFAHTSSFFGSEAAERQFKPDDFARLSQYFNPDQAKKDSANLGTIASGLQNLFPTNFNGAIR